MSDGPPSTPAAAEAPSTYFDHNRALVIGVGAYPEPHRLPNAPRDAAVVAEVLRARHGFESVESLIDAEATRARVRAALAGLASLTRADRLLVYVSCHGVSKPSDGVRPDGYLVLHDATIGDASTYLPMRELYLALAGLACRHLLVVLDCCFAGMFVSLRELGEPLAMNQERYHQFLHSGAWQVLASAARDQRAFDALPPGLSDDDAHSPFAAAFLAGLAGGGDLDRNGLVTATELYWYVRNRVERRDLEPALRQTPCLFPFAKHEHGEFAFAVAPIALERAPMLSADANPYRGLQTFARAHAARFVGRSSVVTELLERIEQLPLVAVVGPSAAGKTSLIEAGLLPALALRAGWTIVSATRTQTPRALHAELVSVLGGEAIAGGAEPPAGADAGAAARTLVVIDDVERVVGARWAAEDVAALLSWLAAALARRPALRVLLIVRADGEGALATGPLQPWWRAGRIELGAPHRTDLRRIVVQPALDLVMELVPDGLVDRLVDEVTPLPAPLPVLSFALAALYETYWNRQARAADPHDRALREEEHGGLAPALAAIAARAAVAPGSDTAAIAQHLIPRLFVGRGQGLRARRVSIAELRHDDARWEQARTALIDHWATARAIVIGVDERGAYVEPLHADLRTPLAEAAKVSPDRSELQRDLEAAVDAWHGAGQPPARLLWDADARLDAAATLCHRPPTLTAREVDFVRASLARRRRRRIVLAAIAAAVVAVIVTIGVIALRQAAARRAERHAKDVARAADRSGAAQGRLGRDQHDEATAAAIAAAATAPADDPFRSTYLAQAVTLIARSPAITARLPGATSVRFAAIHHDGTRIAGRDETGGTIWIDGPRWRRVPLALSAPAILQGPLWSPDGALLVGTVGADSCEPDRAGACEAAVVVWDTAGEERARREVPRGARVRQLRFCGDGCVAFLVGSAARGGSAELVILASPVVGAAMRETVSRPVAADAQTVAADGLVVLHEPGRVSLVDPLRAGEPPTIATDLRAVGASADGQRLYALTSSPGESFVGRRTRDRFVAVGTPAAVPLDVAEGATVAVETDRERSVDVVVVTSRAGGVVIYEADGETLQRVAAFDHRVAVVPGGGRALVRDVGTDAVRWYRCGARARRLPWQPDGPVGRRPASRSWVGSGLVADGVVSVDRAGYVQHVVAERDRPTASAAAVSALPVFAADDPLFPYVPVRRTLDGRFELRYLAQLSVGVVALAAAPGFRVGAMRELTTEPHAPDPWRAALSAAVTVDAVPSLFFPDRLRAVTLHLPRAAIRVTRNELALVGPPSLPLRLDALPLGARLCAFSDDGRLVAAQTTAGGGGTTVLVHDVAAGVTVAEHWLPARAETCRIDDGSLEARAPDGTTRSWPLVRDPARVRWLGELDGRGWPIMPSPGREAEHDALVDRLRLAALTGDEVAALALSRIAPSVTGESDARAEE